MRIGVLRSDPNIRNFMEKLAELEKIIRCSIDFLKEWANFQRNYVYLFGIFGLVEMRTQMPGSSKMFLSVKKLYDTSMHEFKESPQVFKVSLRETFLQALNKANQDCEFIRRGLKDFLE